MDLRLSDEQRAVRETFAALFRKESTPQRVRIAESAGIDKALWQSYAQLEALGIGIPADYGGADGGLLELALIAEEAGRRLAPIPIAETAAAARLLGRLGEKELLAPVLTGSNIVSLATRSRPVGDQLLVDGAIADAVLAFDGKSLLYVTTSGRAAGDPAPQPRWPAPGALGRRRCQQPFARRRRARAGRVRERPSTTSVFSARPG